jgi:hypothetical protein
MVNIVENWAQIHGVVESIVENPKLSKYSLVNLDLKGSAPVGSFPNLARADEGKTIKMNVMTSELGTHGIRRGATISCIVRKAYGQVYFMK